MEKDVFVKRAKIIATVLAVLAVIILLISLISYYMQSFKATMLGENVSSLSEITKNIADKTQILVGDLKKTVEMAALMIHNVPKDENGTIYLDSLKEKYNFEFVGYAFPSGVMISTSPSFDGNVGAESFFLRGMKGESVLEYIPLAIAQDKVVAGLRISAPIYNLDNGDGQPVGVLVTMLDIGSLSNSIQISSFNQQGVTYIIDPTGATILHTSLQDYSNLYMVLQNNEFAEGYSLDKVKADLAARQSGFAIYSQFGIDKYMQYQYIGIDGWSVVTVIEKSIMTAATSTITKQMMVVGFGIMIVFPLLLIFAMSSLELSKVSRQATKEKSVFLANMSHEIRTPMNAIVGISEILLRENLTGKQKGHVLSIINAGNGLLTIINDILDISKIEAGKFSIIEEEYEFESLIYDIVTITSIKIGEKPLELLVDVDPEMPKYVVGDMSRVKQVLLNVIGNAVKFTKTGYVKLSVRAKLTHGKLELTMPVEDTGIGIKKEDLKKLFSSFSQVDTHRNHGVEGTGLGLAISKRLCEMMDGDVTVESVYGKGSVFTINLTQTVTRPDKMMDLPDCGRFNLLLLEPSEALGGYYRTCMGRMGLRYQLCSDYEDFAQLLAAGGFTHAVASPKFLNRLSSEGRKTTGALLVSLVDLHEQVPGDSGYATVMTPLFTMQLAAVLKNRKEQTGTLKRSGIDVNAIHPMPFVQVLLVDDNEVNLQVANGLMVPYHMRVDCAASGQTAIDMLGHRDYDLIFMDHMMPEMDGVETVKIIRSLPESRMRAVPIIALTANVTSDARNLFITSGFNDFLSKPIETVKLNELLKKWLKEINDERARQHPELNQQLQEEITQKYQEDRAAGQGLEAPATVYMDFNTGIEKLGSVQTYCDILDTYCRTTEKKLAELPLFLREDLDRFRIEVHGLKGASGGICALLAAKEALELEGLAIDNQQKQIEAQLPQFLDVLETTLSEIKQFVARNRKQPRPPSRTVPPGEYQSGQLSPELLSSIKEAFLDFDADRVTQLFDEQEHFVYDKRESELLSQLKNCLESYDFERSIKLLEGYEAELL